MGWRTAMRFACTHFSSRLCRWVCSEWSNTACWFEEYVACLCSVGVLTTAGATLATTMAVQGPSRVTCGQRGVFQGYKYDLRAWSGVQHCLQEAERAVFLLVSCLSPLHCGFFALWPVAMAHLLGWALGHWSHEHGHSCWNLALVQQKGGEENFSCRLWRCHSRPYKGLTAALSLESKTLNECIRTWYAQPGSSTAALLMGSSSSLVAVVTGRSFNEKLLPVDFNLVLFFTSNRISYSNEIYIVKKRFKQSRLMNAHLVWAWKKNHELCVYQLGIGKIARKKEK